MNEKELRKLGLSLHSLERSVLPRILECREVESLALKSDLGIEDARKGLLLLEQRGLVELEILDEEFVFLDRFGEKFAKGELPEGILLNSIKEKGKRESEIPLEKEELSLAIGILKRLKLIDVRAEGELVISLSPNAKIPSKIENKLGLFLNGIKKDAMSLEEMEVYESFKMRKGFLRLAKKKNFNFRLSKKGEEVLAFLKKNKMLDLNLIDGLGVDMIKSGDWRSREFRHYDVSVSVPIPEIGRRHPMIEANNILKDVFVEMGFSEMEGPMVETAFWNMDVMWIPQDHPARDEQDTFYLEGEGMIPKDIADKVCKMHEEGIIRTHTEKGGWSFDIARRRLLRTHSTATSFRTLASLGERYKKGEEINGKYFYVANNFRNEAIDATHLAEFYQAEGFIVGDDLSLADLMGFIKAYYSKLGIDKIRFKPTFNPYTEPSMEAHYYDERMGKWYSLINSGIFRPETLKPFGLENKRVIAWGMGASRVATLLANVSSMREITGYTCDFNWLKVRPQMKRNIVRVGGGR